MAVAERSPEKRCLGIIAFQHEVRHSAAEAIADLKAAHIKVKLMAPVVGAKYLQALWPLEFDEILESPGPKALYEYVINSQHRKQHLAVAGLSPFDFPAIH